MNPFTSHSLNTPLFMDVIIIQYTDLSVYSAKITNVISKSFFLAHEKDWTSRGRTRATWRVGAASSDVWTLLWSGSTPGETTISLFCYHSISLRTLTCSQDSEYPRKAERCVNTFQGGTIPFHLVCSVRGEEMSQDDDVGFLYKTMSELLQYCMRIIPVIMFHRCGT